MSERHARARAALLDALCVRLGFCLAPSARDAIIGAPPPSVETLARRVWSAEGMAEPAEAAPLFRQLCRAIAEFPRTGSMQLRWPDGGVVADVDVAADCRPLETGLVVGTFEAGPDFHRLADARFDGLTASDELGRTYLVADLVLDGPRLSFAAYPSRQRASLE